MPYARPKPLHHDQTYSDLYHWLCGRQNQLFLNLERLHIEGMMPRIFGYRMLQVGAWGYGETWPSATSMLNHLVIGVRDGHGAKANSDGENLPIKNDTQDAVLLPHSLELVASPHRLLREVDRVLCPYGHVLVAGFNPLSFWAFRQWLPWGAPYERHRYLYSLGRVCDWLELLDFEIREIRRYGVGFPWLRNDGTDQKLFWLRRMASPVAMGYQILARKRVIPVTPVRERGWRKIAAIGPSAMPEAHSRREQP